MMHACVRSVLLSIITYEPLLTREEETVCIGFEEIGFEGMFPVQRVRDTLILPEETFEDFYRPTC